MVFEDDFTTECFGEWGEGFAENVGVLGNNGGERDDENDAAKSMFFRMAQSKEERRKGFPASGGDC